MAKRKATPKDNAILERVLASVPVTGRTAEREKKKQSKAMTNLKDTLFKKW